MKKIFSREYLEACAQTEAGDAPIDVFAVVCQNKIVDKLRWETQHYMVFRDLEDGKFYQIYYRTPSTENGDWDPFYSEEHREAEQVEPYVVEVTEYRVKA